MGNPQGNPMEGVWGQMGEGQEKWSSFPQDRNTTEYKPTMWNYTPPKITGK